MHVETAYRSKFCWRCTSCRFFCRRRRRHRSPNDPSLTNQTISSQHSSSIIIITALHCIAQLKKERRPTGLRIHISHTVGLYRVSAQQLQAMHMVLLLPACLPAFVTRRRWRCCTSGRSMSRVEVEVHYFVRQGEWNANVCPPPPLFTNPASWELNSTLKSCCCRKGDGDGGAARKGMSERAAPEKRNTITAGPGGTESASAASASPKKRKSHTIPLESIQRWTNETKNGWNRWMDGI